MTEAASLLQLLRLPYIGPVGLNNLLMDLKRINVPPTKIHELSDDCLALDLKLTRDQIEALRSPTSDAEDDLRHCESLGIDVLLPHDNRYPTILSACFGHSAPHLLFAQGKLDLLQLPGVAISGYRQAADVSLASLTVFCEAAGTQDWVIISGGARGADEAAHLCAIRAGAGTIIVLPTGLFRPNFRKELRKHLDEGKVLLLSEFPPEQGWTPGSAMQRNRLIAALSRAVVLVEPGIRGGTTGTGKIALKLGIPLFVLDSGGGWKPPETRFLEAGAQPIDPNGLIPKELTLLLQSAWEKSVINRRSKTESSSR